jgi:outer membrane lipoprotein LolB
MNFRALLLVLLSTQLLACADRIVKESALFKLEGRDYLYQKSKWTFSGRLAISDGEQSLSAAIVWGHDQHRDAIELSGAFGQGRTLIELTEGKMIVDNGDRRVQYSGQEDVLVSNLLGLAVPVSALKYWVRGLVLPEQGYVLIDKGFLQSQWQVKYLQMQFIGRDELPRKIKIDKGNARLKLVINQWQ